MCVIAVTFRHSVGGMARRHITMTPRDGLLHKERVNQRKETLVVYLGPNVGQENYKDFPFLVPFRNVFLNLRASCFRCFIIVVYYTAMLVT